MTFHAFRLGHLFGFLAASSVPLAMFATKGLAPVFVAAVIFGLAFLLLEKSPLPRPDWATGLTALAFVLWAALSLSWSVSPAEGIRYLPVLSAMFVGGFFLVGVVSNADADNRRLIDRYVVFGVLAGLVILAIEIWSPLVLTTFFRRLLLGENVIYNYTAANFYKAGACVAAVMLWPALAALWRAGRTSVMALFGLFAGGVIWASDSGAAFLGLAAGAASLAIFLVCPKWAGRLFAAGLTLGILAMPTLPPLLPDPGQLEVDHPGLPNAVYPRIFIWKSAVDYIEQAPIVGLGLNTSRTLSSSESKVTFTIPGTAQSRQTEAIPLHPHNAALQIWLELGVFGAVLISGFVIALIGRIQREVSVFQRGFDIGALMTGLVIWLLAYSTWSSWWQGTLWICAACLAAGTSRRPTGSKTN
ncbi:hypothetical protein JCM17960_14250 [Magnetospira thiophila]